MGPNGRGPAEIAESLGRVLATCHSAGRDDDPSTRASFNHMMPWGLNVAFPSPGLFRDISPLQLEIIRLIQRHRSVLDRIREMRRAAQWSSFTHGDVRWNNVLVDEQGAIRLIDWEAAGIGDPAWDVACAFEGWLSRGLETLELQEQDGPGEASSRFKQ